MPFESLATFGASGFNISGVTKPADDDKDPDEDGCVDVG